MAPGTARTTGTDDRRRVVVSEMLTLDGFIVGPGEDMSWAVAGFDRQMQDDVAEDIARTGVFVFGRVTYDILSAYWPHAEPYEPGDELKPAEGREDPRIIGALNDRPKVVFSTTMGEPAWAGTRVVAGGVEEEVRRLVTEPGGAVLVQGSASIVQALERAGLVDEYHLYLHPVLLGAGTPLFPTGFRRRDLDLTGLTGYPNGVIALTYERKDGPR
jgi:dihydrofolate reductase